MFTQLKSKKIEVGITKGNTPKECLSKGIDVLGGISKFIDDGDQVFIKFNLSLPGGFPININFDILQTLILSCKNAGAKQVFLGSFPPKGISIKLLSDMLHLNEYFQTLGADLAFLDNSNNYGKKIDRDQLKKIKYNSHTKVEIKDQEFIVPNTILNSNKLILVNQISVNPLFKLNLSLLNHYSIIPANFQEIGKKKRTIIDYLTGDLYKKDLISNIFDVLEVKRPNLIINDLFYVLEAAGPYPYKDSNLKKTGIIILGEEAISVDLVTLSMLNIDIKESELIQEAQNRAIFIPKLSDIRILGEKIEDIKTKIKLCASKLEEIRLRNISTNSGQICSGCFEQAYHLLNVMKTYMDKDLKYNNKNSFLIGENPPEPEKGRNIILFGDCAIKSTKDYNFRKIISETKRDLKKSTKQKDKRESKSKSKVKVKEKPNKNILNLSGCPPNFFNCIESIIKYFKKKNLPNLNLLMKMNNLCIPKESIDKLKVWEAL